MASNTHSYHGMLTSLYHTIDPEHVDHLEKAIWTSKVGKYDDALAIFVNFLGSVLDVPVVLIELSYLHYHNFRYKDLCNLLEPRIERLKQDDPTRLDDPEWRLLALIYSVGANRGRGWMEPGLHELQRTQQWLAKLPVSQYTELHVQIAWRYVIAYLMTRLFSELEGNLDDYHNVPLPTELSPTTAPWQGLGDLRRELVKQCRWKEASAIFKPELNRTPLKERRIVAEAFLQDLQGCQDPNKNLMLASVLLQMAKAMVEVHDLASAKDDTILCIESLDQWCVDIDLEKNATVPFRFEIEQLQLSFIAGHEERLRRAVNLADRMSKFGHSNESSCLDLAAQTANKTAELTGNLEYRKQSLQLRERLERYNEDVTGDLCDLSAHAYEAFTIAQQTHVDARKAVEWIDGFMAKYPTFRAPRIMESLYTRKAVLLHTLKDMEGAEAAAVEALKWDASKGSWKGVNLMNRSNVVAPGDGALGQAPYDSEDDNDDDEGFLEGWANTYADETPTMVISKMIEFALQDVAAGRLQVAEVCMIFDIHGDVEAHTLDKTLMRLKDEDQKELFERLWVPGKAGEADKKGGEETKSAGATTEGAATEEVNPEEVKPEEAKTGDAKTEEVETEEAKTEEVKPVVSNIEEANPENLKTPEEKGTQPLHPTDPRSPSARYNSILAWLQKPIRGSRDRRQMCLLRFLDLHKEMAAELVLRDVAIHSCENLLRLQDSLPRMLKEFTTAWSYPWHSAIAWNIWAKFISGGQWTLFDNFGLLLDIDKRCDQAIEGYRKTNQITGLANIQRLQAQVGLLCLRRLVIYKRLVAQKERTPFEDRVVEISQAQFGGIENVDIHIPLVKEQGLKLLTEIDEIFSSTEREACWEDGLEGIQKRTELSRMQRNDTTTRYAIRHWVDGVEEFSEEARTAIWNLTQKYKARLLSLAIGLYRSNPPSLIQRIQSSDGAHMYQEMVDLQTKIDEALLKDRFYLRLRMDEHRKKMKDHPLLRQLIELREGTPLSLDSLENLTSQLEDDVVLVDWFYLDPFFDRGKLLLLTVRKGQTPTVDELAVDVHAIEQWKKEHLTASEWPKGMDPKIGSKLARKTFNEICGAVIQPLAKRTNPDDILVLCPTDFLNGMPLHALDIDGEALLWRNPCVYVHSHSLLRPCASAAQYASDTATPLNRKFLSGIDKDAVLLAAGRDSIVDLSTQLQGTTLIDESATKANFLDNAKESRLLHIQTHCSWDSSNPLDHHIEFAAQGVADAKSVVKSMLSHSGESPDHKLTAREVFALRLQQGAHLNVIACSGAMTDLKAGDEVMGLVPALLYSGASSVVSTLWPTHDAVGASFSRAFFENFVEQCGEGARWVNVARAVQEGVMELDPDQNAGLLTWASVVLNGYWMFAV
ncbi:hypothetical protein P171DRAFT_468581 [Karstenula rhodostoma CBS 690.94]|uniref:CHAT domain-containing protein n=1 Tax=Karstenula rhodostoma CBS 690.94 TaxID=1392251 RepID=A0A9P4UHF5_9PLEO|nr:hypothetical protein P171DRAFT_468581 [Karstenula rhodostoma CBS 690.94]